MTGGDQTRRVIEIASTGIDEFLQGIGGDPFRGSSAVGLRVPALATSSPDTRYLFLLAVLSIAEATRARILGYRQLVTLGKNLGGSTPRFVEQEVTSPFFRLPDGNVSFHLRRLGPPNSQGFPQPAADETDLRSFVKNFADGPALLYSSYAIPLGNAFYTNVTAYVPPNLGRPWGTPLRASQFGTVYDLRSPWRTQGAWRALGEGVDCVGPDTIALFASVRQSAGAAAITPPSPFYPGGLSAEEQFILNFPGCLYWRVGGSLIVEMTP